MKDLRYFKNHRYFWAKLVLLIGCTITGGMAWQNAAGLRAQTVRISGDTTVGTVHLTADEQYAVYSDETYAFDGNIYRTAFSGDDGPHLVAEEAVLVPQTHRSRYGFYTLENGGVRSLFAVIPSSGKTIQLSPDGVDVRKDEWHFYGQRVQLAADNSRLFIWRTIRLIIALDSIRPSLMRLVRR